jgi:hypothetical protein
MTSLTYETPFLVLFRNKFYIRASTFIKRHRLKRSGRRGWAWNGKPRPRPKNPSDDAKNFFNRRILLPLIAAANQLIGILPSGTSYRVTPLT